MKMIDDAISAINSNSRSFETTIKLSDINYPEQFRKLEELIGESP